jgi:hypothetical protein
MSGRFTNRGHTFEIIDHGWDRITRQLGEAGNSYTKVGLPENGKTSGESSMPEVINYAAINEFGCDEKKIPERAFMRESADENILKIEILQKEALDSVVVGTSTVRNALRRIGEEVKEMVVQKIMSGPWVANAPSTIRKKGFDQPLIDTRQMMNTIQHEEVIYGKV